MPDMQVPATMEIEIKLEAQQWAAIVNILGEAPYRVAAPLIEPITNQLRTAANTEISPPVTRNGRDRASA